MVRETLLLMDIPITWVGKWDKGDAREGQEVTEEVYTSQLLTHSQSPEMPNSTSVLQSGCWSRCDNPERIEKERQWQWQMWYYMIEPKGFKMNWFICVSVLTSFLLSPYFLYSIHSFFKNIFKILFIYLTAPGLSCSTWDLQSSLWHMGSSPTARDESRAPCIRTSEP